jgi:hypothetical protein
MAVEQVEIKDVRETRANVFHVPVKQWRKWGPLGKKVFNEVYSAMAGNQKLFLHPHAEKLSRRMWKTTCWNAAWIAADATK